MTPRLATLLRSLPLAIVLPVALAACGQAGTSSDEEVASDTTDPVLQVQTPERGAYTADGAIRVTGIASDEGSGVVSVEVAGQKADLSDDGSFTADLQLRSTLETIETIAYDANGNSARDLRAVLVGAPGVIGDPIDDALLAQVGPAGFGAIGGVAGAVLSEVDLTAAVGAQELLKAGGSCLGVTLQLEGIDKGETTVDMAPTAGAITARVSLDDLSVRMRARFKVACIGGSTSVRIKTDATHVRGTVGARLEDGQVVLSFRDAAVSFDGFDLDVGGLPDALVEFVVGDVDGKAAAIIEEQISEMLPPLAADLLSEFFASAWDLSVLGVPMTLSSSLSTMSIAQPGMFVSMNLELEIPSAEGSLYITSPTAPPALGTDKPYELALADDFFNQLLAGLWAAGVLDLSVGGEAVEALRGTIGDNLGGLSVQLSLPPVVAPGGSGSLRLLVGDLIVTFKDREDETLAAVAISAQVEFSAMSSDDGRIMLTTGDATIAAQVLETSPNLAIRIDDKTAAALAEVVVGDVADKANEALVAVPIPAIADLTLGATTLAGESGYVRMSGELERIEPAPDPN